MTAEMVRDIEGGRRMRGLDRAVEILDYLRKRRRPARPNEIAVDIAAPKSTTYELVDLLVNSGMLEYADKEGRVFLGRKLYSSASPTRPSSTSRANARPISTSWRS